MLRILHNGDALIRFGPFLVSMWWRPRLALAFPVRFNMSCCALAGLLSVRMMGRRVMSVKRFVFLLRSLMMLGDHWLHCMYLLLRWDGMVMRWSVFCCHGIGRPRFLPLHLSFGCLNFIFILISWCLVNMDRRKLVYGELDTELQIWTCWLFLFKLDADGSVVCSKNVWNIMDRPSPIDIADPILGLFSSTLGVLQSRGILYVLMLWMIGSWLSVQMGCSEHRGPLMDFLLHPKIAGSRRSWLQRFRPTLQWGLSAFDSGSASDKVG